jgi:hypothetical protein
MDVEGGGGLIRCMSQLAAKGTKVNYRKLRIVGVPVEIRTGYLPYTSSKLYR